MVYIIATATGYIIAVQKRGHRRSWQLYQLRLIWWCEYERGIYHSNRDRVILSTGTGGGVTVGVGDLCSSILATVLQSIGMS